MWQYNKKEWFIGGGATGFLSDLGGLDRVGTGYSPIDLDFPGTKYMGHLGFRYRFKPMWATRSTLSYARLFASDQLTGEIYRNNRNLTAKTHVIEFSQTLEFIIFARESFGKRYNLPWIKGQKGHNEQLYLFAGIGAFFYAPQAADGTNLRPLKTEGQGLPDGPDPYGMFNICIPMGIGYKFAIGSNWRLGIEASYRMTFTDYLDDVSTDYYDKTILEDNYGAASAFYSDPSGPQNPNWTTTGEQRGDPREDDAYLFLSLTVYKNISYKSNKRYKTRQKWKVKASF